MILSSERPATLLGASKTKPHDVEEILKLAPFLVAADGGAAKAVAMGLRPEAVIGDFDSLAPEIRAALPGEILHQVAEQESTDFEKCLRRIEAPLILAIGFTGRRLDHELAVYNALARYPGKRCIVIGRNDIVFLAPRSLEIDLPIGSRFSLFPLDRVSGTSEGLEWPLDGISFGPSGRIGTSNRVSGLVRLNFDADAMLVITPRAALEAAMRALALG